MLGNPQGREPEEKGPAIPRRNGLLREALSDCCDGKKSRSICRFRHLLPDDK